jgi:general secretion pathway protein L
MSILKIYFSDQWRDATSPCPWALCDDKGALLQSGLDPLAGLPKGHECIAIVAPERVLNIAATLPPGGRRRWQAVLPFVAEEFALTDPEENHVVPGAALADGRRMLAVVDRQWLTRIVEGTRAAKLSLRRMVAESHMPELAADSWVLVWNGHTGFVKTGVDSGSELDRGDERVSPLALRLSLDTAPQIPKKIVLRYPHDLADEQRKLPQWGDVHVPLEVGSDWDWRRAAMPEETLNLLWGSFTPRAKIQAWWPKLRPAAYVVLAVLVLEMVATNIEWAMLLSEKNQLTQSMKKTFRTTFGDAVSLVNAPLQMQRNLMEERHAAGIPDSGDFLPLFNLAGRTLATLPAGSIGDIHYEEGRLDVMVKLPGKADFVKLKQSLQGNGLGVRIDEISDQGNGAEAKVILMPGGVQ